MKPSRGKILRYLMNGLDLMKGRCLGPKGLFDPQVNHSEGLSIQRYGRHIENNVVYTPY